MSHPPPKPEPTNPDEHAPGMSRTLERTAKLAQEHADRLQHERAAEDETHREDPSTT